MRILPVLVFGLVLGGLAAAQSSTVLPERFLRSYDPVTVRYDKAVGPEGGGPADGPGPFLTVNPSPAGEYRWSDSRTIQFLPAEPWPTLRTIEVRTAAGTTRLAALLSPPSSVQPSVGTRNLEPFDHFDVQFAEDLTAADLAPLVRVELRPLPGVGDQGLVTLGVSDLAVLPRENRSGQGSVFRIQWPKPVGYGSSATLVFRLSTDPALPDAVSRTTVETRAPFSLVTLGAGPVRLPVSPSGSQYRADQAVAAGAGDALSLEFSEPVTPVSLETVKNMVRFDPAVDDLTFQVQGSRLVLRFRAQREALYRMSVTYQPLISATGRVLQTFGPSALTFYLPKADPYLNWRTAEGLVERYGPQTLPLEGRATGRVDLRIYPVDALDTQFWPWPTGAVVVDEAVRPTQPGLSPRKGDWAGLIRDLPSPPVSRVVNLPVSDQSDRQRFGLDLRPILAATFGADRPGTYLVGYRTLGSSTSRSYVRVTVTDLSLSVVEEEDAVVFAVTSLKTGLPVSDALLRIEGMGTGKPVVLWEGKTDSRGLLRYDHRSPWGQIPGRVSVRTADDVLVLDPTRGLPVFANNHWASGDGYWLSWLGDTPRQTRRTADPRAYLLSERPMYKPEETVHLVGWIKDRIDGELRTYSGGKVQLEVRGPDEERVWTLDAKPNAFGTLTADFADEDLAVGTYSVRLVRLPEGPELATTQFQIQSYRVPTFQVDLSGPDLVPLDRPFAVQLTADYYSGGRLVGQPVRWTVTQYPYSISSPQWAGFLFSTDERFNGASSFSSVGSGNWEGELDQTGAARLELNPSAEPDGRARRYIINAQVAGADRQTVSQTKQVAALPPFVVGLNLSRIQTGTKTTEARLLVLDHQEKPVAGIPLTLRVLQRQWHSYLNETDFTTGEAQYTTDVVDTLISEQSLVSQDQPWSVSVPVPEPGVYVFEVFGRDYLGRQVLVRADTFVPGTGSVAWPRKKDQVFELTPDKSAYDPGDQASLLIKSPYQTGRALVVVEAPRGNEYRWVDVTGGKAVVKVDITGEMAPNLPVSALLIRGRIGETEGLTGLDLSKPASVGASLSLSVRPRTHQAELTLNHPVKAAPGNRMRIELKLNDPEGHPLDGQAAVWLVDKAVLALAPEKRLDPLPAFLPAAHSWVRIGDLRNRFLGRLPVEEVAGGDGSEEAIFLELINKSTVRKNFLTVPYFNATVPITNGAGSLEFALPDNLTDFAVRAVAVTENGRFGSAKSVVSVRLPVLVQSSLPRYLRPGDETLAGGVGRVVEGSGGPAAVALQLEGLTTGNNELKVETSFTLPDAEASVLRFPIRAAPTLTVGSPASVLMAVRRLIDGASDAFQLPVPIRPDQDKKLMVRNYSLADRNPVTVARPLEGSRAGQLEQTLVIGTDARMVALLQAVPYLAAYPHGCVEQRTSQLYPAVLFQGLQSLAGLPGTDVRLPAWKSYFEYLAGAQDPSGLFSLWPGSRGSVALTAYVAEFLSEAQKVTTVPPALLSGAREALTRAIRSDASSLLSGYGDPERVEALSALVALGGADDGYLKDLATRGPALPLYSQARLYRLLKIRKLDQGGRGDALVRNLRAALASQTVAGKAVFSGLSGRWDVLRPLMVSEVRTVSALLEALTDDQPSAAARSLAVDWMLAQSGSFGWGNTIDTASALRALRALASDTGGRTVTVTVTVDGKAEKVVLSKARVATVRRQSDSAVVIAADGVSASAPVTVAVRTSYLPTGLGSVTAAESRGFTVTREWTTVTGTTLGTPKTVSRLGPLTVALGTVVEEHIRVSTTESRGFVAVSVPLAAGWELLNPALATSGPEATPSRTNSLNPAFIQMDDDQIRFYFDELPPGTFDLYFRVRADFEGSYIQPPASAEAMYQPEVRGSSDGTRVKITAQP